MKNINIINKKLKMGSLCAKNFTSTDIERPREQEREIQIQSYSSNVDEPAKLLETTYMFLREIYFDDYVHSLCKFSMENATLEDNYSDRILSFSCNDPWFNEEMTEDHFQVFIDNKIVKHKAVVDKLQDDTKCSVFKDIMIKFYKKLNDKLKRGNENFTFKKIMVNFL